MYRQVVGIFFEAAESFYTNSHAVYMGTVRYTKDGSAYAQPGAIVIEVRDGKVTRQWDFVDYTVGPTG